MFSILLFWRNYALVEIYTKIINKEVKNDTYKFVLKTKPKENSM